MKVTKWFSLVLAVCLASGAAAQGLRLGVHGAYTTGGEVEDSSIGYGLQAELGLSRHISVELAATMFSDEAMEEGVKAELDMTTLAASLKLRLPLAETLDLFVLGGASYNMTDIEYDLGEWSFLTVKADVDDGIGYHVGGGASLRLGEQLELFAEYRYTFYELEYEVTVQEFDIRESDKEDYNFGLLKVGLNLVF